MRFLKRCRWNPTNTNVTFCFSDYPLTVECCFFCISFPVNHFKLFSLFLMNRPEHQTLQWWLWEHIWTSSTLTFALRDWPHSELIFLQSADPRLVPEPLATRTSPGSICSKRTWTLVGYSKQNQWKKTASLRAWWEQDKRNTQWSSS